MLLTVCDGKLEVYVPHNSGFPFFNQCAQEIQKPPPHGLHGHGASVSSTDDLNIFEISLFEKIL